MDINALATEDVGELVIKDNHGDATDIVFILAGFDHPARLDSERKASRRFLRGMNKAGKPTINEDPDELWEEETERLVKMTVGWRNLQAGGVDIPFSPEKAREIYDNRKLGFRDQVRTGLADREVFTRRSSAKPLPTSSASFG